MAMIERQVFDDTVKGAGAVGGGGGDRVGGGSGVSSSGSSSSRNPLRAEAEVCAQCGTTPAAISRADAASAPTAPDTGSLPGSRRAASTAVVQSTNNNTQQQVMASASPPSLSVSAPQPAVDRIRTSSSPIVGMRGGLGGAGGASEPIRGLAAFGSQGSITSSSRNSRGTARQGGGGGAPGSSRLSPRRPASNDPAPRACTCQEGGGGGAKGGGGRSGGAPGSRGGGGGGSGAGNGSSAKRSAARSHSPYRGGNGNNGNNGTGGDGGGGASSSGPKIPAAAPATAAAAPARDPGYRVLHWSELTQLTYMTMGAMCEIYSADLDGVKVAVKVPRSDCEEPAVAEHDLEVELDVLKRVSHKHIIALVGAGNKEEKPHRFLVLEFLELGTLADKLDNGSSGSSRQKRNKRYQDFYMVTMLERSLELALALEHLHHHLPETFVVHRDLKPDNVGFKADGTLKLFDFGLARVVKRRNRVNARYEMTGETGSMRYMAPEVVESLPYNEKVDVYAFGLLLWEMLEDNRVFDGMGVADFYERVVNAGARPNLDMAWPQDLRKLISQCWHADVDRRPNFRVIAERLRHLYHGEKQSSKLCMSALNLNEGEHPNRGGSSVNVIVRSATATNVVGPRSRGGGPSSQTEIGNKRGGVLRRSFSKMGRMFNPKKGGAKATLTHTAPEAYSRNGRHLNEPTGGGGGGGGGDGVSRGASINGNSELGDAAVYAEDNGGSGGGRGSENTIGVRRAHSDGMIRQVSNNR